MSRIWRFIKSAILIGITAISAYTPEDVPPILRESEWNLNINFGPGPWSDACQYTPHYLTNNGSIFSLVNTTTERTFDGFEYQATFSKFPNEYFGFPPATGLFNYENQIESGWNTDLTGNTSPSTCGNNPYLPAFSSFLKVNYTQNTDTSFPFNETIACGPLYAVAVPKGHKFAVNIRLVEIPSPDFLMAVNDIPAFLSPSPLLDEPFYSYSAITYSSSGYIVIGALTNTSFSIATLTISDLTSQLLGEEDYFKNLLYGTLRGNITLITGSSRGIGRLTAFHISSFGSSVLIDYLDREEKATEAVIIIRAFGGSAVGMQGDVRIQGTFGKLVNASDNYFGGLTNNFIVNAGIVNYYYFWQYPEPYPGYFDLVDQNVISTIAGGASDAVHFLLPRFLSQKSPTFRRLFFTNSIASRLGSQGPCPPYGAAKGEALIWMREFVYNFIHDPVPSTSNNYSFTDVGILALRPKGVLTDLSRNGIYDFAEPPLGNIKNATELADFVNFVESQSVFYAGNLIYPSQIASLYTSLISSSATPYFLGNVIDLDYGVEILSS